MAVNCSRAYASQALPLALAAVRSPNGQRLRWWATLRDWRVRVAPGPSTALEYSQWLRRR